MARILISGATGFIGAPLSQFLESQGHCIVRLARFNDEKFDFEGFDIVIHLAGEPLTLSRWSAEKKRKIFSSRVDGTKFLSEQLMKSPPRLFLSASAFGYYGDRGEEELSEESGPGSGFLSKVCVAWEKASDPLKAIGVRVVYTRFGIVIGPHGGALKKLAALSRWGLAGKLGSGKQWVSWIALNDLIRAVDVIIQNESLKGPVNMVSPKPVRQEEFVSTLATLLHRPHFLRAPGWALKLGLGTSADEMLLASAKVVPEKLLAAKFAFKYPDLRSAMSMALQNT